MIPRDEGITELVRQGFIMSSVSAAMEAASSGGYLERPNGLKRSQNTAWRATTAR